MELARVTSKGQITIPREIRKKLGLKPGDKVLFVEEDGRITVSNSAQAAITSVQSQFQGAAEDAGITDEQDVVDLVRDVRSQRRKL